jgi:hypothetical protein
VDLTIEEQQDRLKTKKIVDNAIVLSNIVELATSVVQKLAGKDVADSINKQSLNRTVLSNLVANRIKEKALSEGK